MSDPVSNAALPKKRKLYQVRALLRSKLSYQKRQYKVNLLCVAFCPFMMVAIGGIIGIILRHVLDKYVPREGYVICSNLESHTVFNMPRPRLSSLAPVLNSSQVPHSEPGRNYTALNMYLFPFDITESLTQLALSQLSDNSPSCVWTFDKNYNFSAPYQIYPGVDISVRRDTTEKPDPTSGWFDLQTLASNQIKFLTNQKYPWMVVRDAPGGGAGYRNKIPPIQINPSQMLNGQNVISNSIQTIISSPETQLKIASNNGSGLLNMLDTYFALDFGDSPVSSVPYIPSQLQALPWYQPVQSSSSSQASEYEIDDLLYSQIKSSVNQLSQLDPNLFKAIGENTDSQSSIRPLMEYFQNVTPIVTQIPWGSLIFDTVNPINLKWKYTLQIGSNTQIANAGSYPPIVSRLVSQQTSLSNGFLRSSRNNTAAIISQSIRGMPQIFYYDVDLPFGSLLGSSLYPFGISFMICIFVLILVKEKEDRILIMMEMNGLKLRYYYLAHYIHFFILSIWSSFFFILAGKIFKLELFTRTELGLLALIMILWSNVQVSLSFFLSTLFKRSSISQVFVYLIVLWGVIVDAAISLIYTRTAPTAYLIWPPFAMYRILDTLNIASISTNRPPYIISDLVPGNDVFRYVMALVIGWFVYLMLAMYLSLVLSGDYGVKKPWYFIFTFFFTKSDSDDAPIKVLSKNSKIEDIPSPTFSQDSSVTDVDSISIDELMYEDQDVKAERNLVLSNDLSQSHPLVLSGLRKVYTSGKVAVKDISIAIERGSIFGLLGPNGAGKTTIISIITGMHKITSGKVYLAGFDITKEPELVHQNVGFCPQHDILWDDLTIEDHLYFYARLKGIPPSEEHSVVSRVIESVRLTEIKNRTSYKLSGGEKRRLSMAISFIGDPSVIFLDEPTTGLDPEVRRTVWSIINDNRVGKTIILTTHSMEEADVLCNRIGIMAQGTMRCIGTQLHLKDIYGSGFLITITSSDIGPASEFVDSLLPPSRKVVDSYSNGISWEFKPTPGLIAHLYHQIHLNKDTYSIDDWGISQTSLDEVFLHIVGENESNATE
ncbi:ABC transporter A family member 7 [Smittium mucronatum]|uniref:ABC transporter A family member 7 n=1 Tax=Smittium mucronatum TaxID=133383 RepID=A0A1R0GY44_9FUNG|nr:ABC transporter A family member 7 [Smittium mucronatum]